MTASDSMPIIEALYAADEQHNPALLFSLLPEDLIWSSTLPLLDNPEYQYLLGPTLLQGINTAFSRLQDKDAVQRTLLHVLQSVDDDVAYLTAQQVILTHALAWSKNATREFFQAFETRYYKLASENYFLAQIALEGAVMLPIFRDDPHLFYRSFSFILESFPLPPTEADDPAFLSVKALKLLGRCYDYRPSDDILTKVHACLGCANYAADTEARFVLGIISLYTAFQANDEASFLVALERAEHYFVGATQSQENRTDAELFMILTQCYLLFLTHTSIDTLAFKVSQAQNIVMERFLMLRGTSFLMAGELEFQCVHMMRVLVQWTETLSGATRWPDLRASLQQLTGLYTAARAYDETKSFGNNLGEKTQKLIMLPFLQGHFLQIQEIQVKLTTILTSATSKDVLTASERAFLALLLQTLQETPSPKTWAATELKRIRVAAEQEHSALLPWLDELQKQEQDPLEALMDLLGRFLALERSADHDLALSEGPTKEIVEKLESELAQALHWETDSLPWKYLVYALRLVARYLVRMYRISVGDAKPEDVQFLFAKGKQGGLGKDAKEGHLETHFYRTMDIANFLGSIERQPQSIAPGRPDLSFRFPGDIRFPVEVKAEGTDISRATIDKQFVAQAQSYAAGLHGVSFLLVLDLTAKKRGDVLPHVTEYCYLAHRPVPHTTRNDYVVVVIIPANRLLPSQHSAY